MAIVEPRGKSLLSAEIEQGGNKNTTSTVIEIHFFPGGIDLYLVQFRPKPAATSLP